MSYLIWAPPDRHYLFGQPPSFLATQILRDVAAYTGLCRKLRFAPSHCCRQGLKLFTHSLERLQRLHLIHSLTQTEDRLGAYTRFSCQAILGQNSCLQAC